MGVISRLLPGMHLQYDIGQRYQRWGSVYALYLNNYSRIPMGLDKIARKSDAFAMASGLDPVTSEGAFLGVVKMKWQAAYPDKELPDATTLDVGTVLKVVGGDWGYGPQPYSLPSAYPPGGWLVVKDGEWKGVDLEVIPLPTVTPADNGLGLGVVGGGWSTMDIDNFYLPYPDIITAEVPHTTTVCGDRWLKRPFSLVSYQRRGLIAPVPGSSNVSFNGTGGWSDVRGSDYGSWQLGDYRPVGSISEVLWLVADGKTLGATSSGADYTGARYQDLYLYLGGTKDGWNTNELVDLPIKAGYEVYAGKVEFYPANLSIMVGPTGGGPYEIEASINASFDNVVFSSRSDAQNTDWVDTDGNLMCSLTGIIRERWDRTSEEYAPNIPLPTSFLYLRKRKIGRAWDYETVHVTEQDVLRTDTVLSAGVYPCGASARVSTAQSSVVMVTGRPVYYDYYKQNFSPMGASISRGGTRKVEPNGSSSTVPEECLRFCDVAYYSTGDLTVSAPPTTDIVMRTLLNQLAGMDGYDLPPDLKFRLTRLEQDHVYGAWFGGVVGADGRIYFVPYNATTMLCIDPRNGRVSHLGKFGANKGKWAGAVAAPDGKIYCMPYSSSNFLVYDTYTGKFTQSTFGIGFKNTPLYLVGGCLTADDRILSLSSVLDIEVELMYRTGVAKQYDLKLAGRQIADNSGFGIKKYGHPVPMEEKEFNLSHIPVPFFLTTPTADKYQTKFGGMVIGPDGQPSAVPCGMWTCEHAYTGAGVDRQDDPVPARPLIYWSMMGKSWATSSYSPLVGSSATPFSCISRMVDYDWRVLGPDGWPVNYIDGTEADINTSSRSIWTYGMNKYCGGTLGPDGNQYFFPCGGSTPDILVEGPPIAPYTVNKPPVSAFRIPDWRFVNCRGGALGPDGNLYTSCADGTAAAVMAPRTRRSLIIETGHPKLKPMFSAWMGVVTGPDGWMYYVPFDSPYILIVDPCVPTNPWPAELNQYINKF